MSLHHDEGVELLPLIFEVILPYQEALLEVHKLLALQVDFPLVAEAQIQRHVFDGLCMVKDDCTTCSISFECFLAHLEVGEILQPLGVALDDEVP